LGAGKSIGPIPLQADGQKTHDRMMTLMSKSWDADDLDAMHRLIKRLGQAVARFSAPTANGALFQTTALLAASKKRHMAAMTTGADRLPREAAIRFIHLIGARTTCDQSFPACGEGGAQSRMGKAVF
jgi:hypothetical protein